MPFIGRQPVIGNFQKCDSISVVNGQAAYTLQVGGVNVSPQSENHMLVSLNGILQAPVDSFTVSGSTLTFASNLVTGDVIDFVMILGNVLDLGVPSDNTVSLAKLTATGTKDATTFLRGDNTFAEAGGGKLLQSSLVTTSTNQALSSSTYTDLTGMSISFTPVSSTSKLLITSFMNIGLTCDVSDESFFSRILRDSTTINDSDTGVGYGSVYFYSSDASNLHLFDINVCEDTSHGTTSAVTIKVQGKCSSGDSIQFNLNSAKKSYLLVQEIEQ